METVTQGLLSILVSLVLGGCVAVQPVTAERGENAPGAMAGAPVGFADVWCHEFVTDAGAETST